MHTPLPLRANVVCVFYFPRFGFVSHPVFGSQATTNHGYLQRTWAKSGVSTLLVFLCLELFEKVEENDIRLNYIGPMTYSPIGGLAIIAC